MSAGWSRVDRDEPCDVCGKPDWCTRADDGSAACCMRVESERPLKNGGWLHRRRAPAVNGNGHAPERRWRVCGTDGVAVAVHARRELGDGMKKMWWERPSGEKGLGGRRVDTLPLYGTERLASLARGETVLLHEGEKSTDAGTRLGYASVGTVTGAPTIPVLEVLWPLIGFDVVLWPDADDPGRALMDGIAKKLVAIGVPCRVLTWPDAPAKGDAADFEAAGLTRETLCPLVDAAVPFRTVPFRTVRPAGVSPSSQESATAATAATEAEGAALLDDVFAFLGRFVAYPSPHAHTAHALWIVHAHLMEAWESTPRIAFLSPEPASGKTRALEVSELLVPRPVEAVNVTPAYLFRKVGADEGRPTILFDEVDTIFGPKAREHEEIRGLLNAGHRRGAVAGRCAVHGKRVEPEEIPAYCAVALAGLGALPDTILTRSVIVRMRRRKPGERVEPYRRRTHAPEGHQLRDRITEWAAPLAERAAALWPAMPGGIEDRDADLWEPLLAVAELAGQEWRERARVAAVALVADSRGSTPSLGVRLLGDLRGLFGEADRMTTEAIIRGLCALEEAPWGELDGGKPLNARSLANYLKAYSVRSQNVRLDDGRTPKGYMRAALADAWERYLPPPDAAAAPEWAELYLAEHEAEEVPF